MGTSLRMMRVIDSHTAGQPTRVIIEGGPQLGGGTLLERRNRLREAYDRFRSAVVGEPRGTDAMAGALLCTPDDSSSAAAVIFFDCAGYPPMSGHGIIGLVTTLEYLGLIQGGGRHRIETPAGVVSAELHSTGDISIENVASFRHRKDVAVETNGFGPFTGDVAWGGDWFFVVNNHREELSPKRVEHLTELAREIREALARRNVAGPNGEAIDAVAFFGAPHGHDARSRNFVLASGKSYDRSPSGAAISAKLACLFEDGLLREGEPWRQESIVGTVFDASVKVIDGAVHPIFRGAAYITADSTLIVDERDPLCWGLT